MRVYRMLLFESLTIGDKRSEGSLRVTTTALRICSPLVRVQESNCQASNTLLSCEIGPVLGLASSGGALSQVAAVQAPLLGTGGM